MALHKEPYGLVYNDDGSLCVTLRNDDKPFEGVTSFAVEEGTENLISNPLDLTKTFNHTWWGHGSINSLIDGGGLFGGDARRVTRSGNEDESYISASDDFGPFTTSNTTYTYSVYVRPYGDSYKNTPFRFYINIHDLDSNTYTVVESKDVWLSPGWQRVSLTFTTTDATNYDILIYNTMLKDYVSVGDGFEITAPQLEQKPFATSFVDGSRPNGSLLLFDDATVRSWADNGIVIAGWWKFNYWSDDKHFRVFSCTESGGFNIEKFPNYDIRLAINDGGTYIHGYFQDPDVFADLDWHFVVFYYRPDTKVAKVYVDAVEQTSVTLSQGLHFNEDIYYSLVIGAELNNPQTVDLQASILVANLFIGKPLDKAGHLIWSDPYIQQLYQAKRPFSVPPKMPVI